MASDQLILIDLNETKYLPIKPREVVERIAQLEQFLRDNDGFRELAYLHPDLLRLFMLGIDVSSQSMLNIEYHDYRTGDIVTTGEEPLDHDLRTWTLNVSEAAKESDASFPQRYFTTLTIEDHYSLPDYQAYRRKFKLNRQLRVGANVTEEGLLEESRLDLSYPPFMSEENQTSLEISSELTAFWGSMHSAHVGRIEDGRLVLRETALN